MKNIGTTALALGALIVLGSFAMDTAPEGTHNIGLLQQQLMIFQFGGLVAIVGALLGSVGVALTRLEHAGILPPAGFKASADASKQ